MKKLIFISFFFNLITPQDMKIKYPELEKHSLVNGLTVYTAEHHEQPAVFFQLLIPLGNFDVAIRKEGVASMAVDMLSKGTKNYSADELSEAIESTGGSLSASSGNEYTTITGRFLKEDLKTGLELMADMVLHPTFPKNEWKLLKKQTQEGIKTWYSDAGTVAQAHLTKLAFGDTPAGNMMTKSTLKNISLDDVKEFYSNLRPDNAVFVLIGDFDTSMANELVENALKEWKSSGAKARRKNIVFTHIDGIRFRLVNNPELEQATIAIGFKALPVNSDERHALNLVNYIFGGHFSSRLSKSVRAEEGKTYGIRSEWESNRDFGAIAISTSTRVEEVRNTYDLIIGEMEKLVDAGLTENELSKAKAYFSGSYPLRFESPATYASLIANMDYYGFTISDRENVIIERNAVTLEEANEIARKYYRPENFVLVIVGNQEIAKNNVKDIANFDEAFYKDDPM